MNGFLTDVAMLEFVKRVEDLVREQVVEMETEKRKKQPTMVKARKSMRAHAVALDKHIKSCTPFDGLNHFHSPSLPGKLVAGETRVFYDMHELPDDVAEASKGFERRSVIEAADGETRLEISWASDRPILVSCGDMGGNAW